MSPASRRLHSALHRSTPRFTAPDCVMGVPASTSARVWRYSASR